MKEGMIVRVAKAFENNKLIFSQQFGGIALALVAVWIGIWYPEQLKIYKILPSNEKGIMFWVGQWTPWFFCISAFTSIYGGFSGAISGKKKDIELRSLREKLQKNSYLPGQLEEAQQAIDYFRIEQANLVYEVTSEFLGHLLNDELSLDDTERASLFLHNGDRFILAGRYSKNKEYTKKNRSAFPDNEGCIGRTLSEGGKYFHELPENEREYFDYLKDILHIDKGTARKLRMKSKAYCSYALQEGYYRVGVVLFESINYGALDKDKLYELAESHHDYFIEMIKRSKKVNALVAYQNGGGEGV